MTIDPILKAVMAATYSTADLSQYFDFLEQCHGGHDHKHHIAPQSVYYLFDVARREMAT